MKLRFRTGVVATSAFVAAALILSGCSSSDSGTTDTGQNNGSNGDAAQLVEDSAQALSEVTGLHMKITTEGTVPNLAVKTLEGDISNDPQTAATGDATLIVGQKTSTPSSSTSTAISTPTSATRAAHSPISVTVPRFTTCRPFSTPTRVWRTC